MAKKNIPPTEDDNLEYFSGEQASGVQINAEPSEIDIDVDKEIQLDVIFTKNAYEARGIISPSKNVFVAIELFDSKNVKINTSTDKIIPETSDKGVFSVILDTIFIANATKGLLKDESFLTLKLTFILRQNTTIGIASAGATTSDDTVIGRFVPSLGGELLGVREIKVLPNIDLIALQPSNNRVVMGRAGQEFTADQVLYPLIRNRVVDFTHYKAFIDEVMCQNQPANERFPNSSMRLPFTGVDAYQLLKAATEAYLMTECGFIPEYSNDDKNPYDNPIGTRRFDFLAESSRLGFKATEDNLRRLRNRYLDLLEAESGTKVLPYFKVIRDKLSDLPLKNDREAGNCYGILRSQISSPCMIELIWSYWQEQGLMVQVINAIMLRFQNIRQSESKLDPLFRLELDPLRNLSNIMWGMVQDEQHTLSISRRAYEYDHQYGLTLIGKAVPQIRSVDSRSNFLDAFHNLLTSCSSFYKDADDTTRIADGFPILNNLRDLHMLLAEGFHNAYGSLTWTARQEMLMQQWVLARPEFREFIGGRIMVPYKEPWMDRVDMVKQMQGWGTTSVTNFHDLATYGEQLLLSIRYNNWSQREDRNEAANWALYWRNEIQRYIYAYRTVTNVDLSVDAVQTTPTQRSSQPSILLHRRLATEAANGSQNGLRVKRA
jgi:hypothetical protein